MWITHALFSQMPHRRHDQGEDAPVDGKSRQLLQGIEARCSSPRRAFLFGGVASHMLSNSAPAMLIRSDALVLVEGFDRYGVRRSSRAPLRAAMPRFGQTTPRAGPDTL